MPTIRVEAAFGYGAYSTPTGGQWVDITANVLDIVTFRGRQTELEQFPAGTCTITLVNDSRQYDPLNTAGPYYGNLVANVPLRVVATISAVDYHVWRGYVDGWPAQYTDAGFRSEVQVQCTDAFKILAERRMPDSRTAFFTTFGTPQGFYKCDDTSKFTNSGTAGRDGIIFSTLALADPLSVGSSNSLAIPAAAPRPGGSITPILISVVLDTPDNLTGGTVWSVALTVLIPSNGYRSLFRTWAAAGATAVDIAVDNDGYLTFIVDGVGATLTATTASTDYADGTARRIVLVRNGTTATLYADGGQVATVTNGAATGSHTGGWHAIGVTPVGSGLPGGAPASTYPAFTIDDLMAWQTRALTAAEVASLNVELTTGFADRRASGLVIGDILDTIGWPASLRLIDAGEVIIQPPANPQGLGALELLQTVAATEGGRLFVDPQGRVTFHDRSRFIRSTLESAVQYTFSDVNRDLTTPPDVGLLDGTLSITMDDRAVFDAAEITREGGLTQYSETSATPSRAYTATGLLQIDDTQAKSLANWIIFRYGAAQARSDSWQVDPETRAADWASILGLEVGHRIRHNLTPGGIGSAISLHQHITLIGHDITPETWVITLNGTPVDRNEAAYFLWATVVTADDDNGWGDTDGIPPGGYWG